jgi:hypothetical protein
MTRPSAGGAKEPVLFVSLKPCPCRLRSAFASFIDLGTALTPIIKDRQRVLYFCRFVGSKAMER